MRLDNLHEITAENSHAAFVFFPLYYCQIYVVVINYETMNYINYDANVTFDIHVKLNFN